MHEILCYGDSNTWGYIPGTGERYVRGVRWSGVMNELLGEDYNVIEEGLNGRTTVWDDPVEGHKNGYKQLIPCLGSHRPLAVVIIMLGTNDLKLRYSVPAFDIALSVGRLVELVQKSGAGIGGKSPDVLLLAPPPLGKLSEFDELFKGGGAKSGKLGRCYEDTARNLGCRFFDTGTIIKSSDIDGVHLSEDSHRILGTKAAELVRSITAT